MPVPTFVLALTNRRELIDGAIPQAWKVEAHVEVPLPDLRKGSNLENSRGKDETIRTITVGRPRPFPGRLHAASGGRVDLFVSGVSSVAAKTEGFSGASMAAVVRAAVARALSRSVEADDVFACAVTSSDFDDAVEDVAAVGCPCWRTTHRFILCHLVASTASRGPAVTTI